LAAENKNYLGKLPLFYALWKSSDDIIKMVFEAYPKAVEYRIEAFVDCLQDLPLHMALRNNASHCTIKMLFYAHPAAAEMKGEDGWLPLHYAVHYCASSETILMLLDTYPKGAQIQNDRGNLPLHCLNWAVVSASVVDKLLEAYPDAARAKNFEGQTPLHCACNKKINKNAFISIQSLISVYPEGIDVEDIHGLLPSDYLTTYINHGHLPSHNGFANYLTRNSKRRHKSIKFLLHMAILNNFSKHLVTLLVRGYPQLCLKRDNHGKIPLHYACEGKALNFISHVMTLLNASAESLYVEDWQGRTPRQLLSNTASREDENKMLPLHHLASASDVLSLESLPYNFWLMFTLKASPQQIIMVCCRFIMLVSIKPYHLTS
jgi:ankyrin repeat protein